MSTSTDVPFRVVIDPFASRRRHTRYKHSFAIAGMKQSAKSSGNRLILYIDYKLRTVSILLLYGKNRIGSPNETAKWRAVIEKQYSEIIENFIV